jgi:hypothetical protein
VNDFLRLVRPYVSSSDDDTVTSAGRPRKSGPAHRKPGPTVVAPVTSDDLAWAYSVAVDPNSDHGEARAAFELIADHSILGAP